MSTPDEYLQIGTPENVVFDYEVAGIGSRFMAGLVDMILIALVDVLVAIVAIIGFQIAARTFSELEGAIWWVAAMVSLVVFAVMGLYYVIFEIWWNGQSPGKRLVNLRVIRADGTPITLSESLIRNFMRLIDFFPLGFGLAFVTMFIDKQSRRLGDLAAGTLVVFDRPEATLESLRPRHIAAALDKPVYHENPRPDEELSLVERLARAKPLLHEDTAPAPVPPILPVERLSDRDIAMAEGYLQRRREFADRKSLATQVAGSLHERLGIPYVWKGLEETERWLSDLLKTYHDRQR